MLWEFTVWNHSLFNNIRALTFTFQQCKNFYFQTMQKILLSNNAKLSLSINTKTFHFQIIWKLLLSSDVKTFTFKQFENFHFSEMWKRSLSNNVNTLTSQQYEIFHFQTIWKLSLSNNVRLSPCNSAWASFQPPPSWSGQFSAPEQSLQEINSDMLSDSYCQCQC